MKRRRIRWSMLGASIRDYRAVSGLTLRELAADLRISYPTVWRAEHGKEVSAETFMVLCDFLQIDSRLFLR